MNIFNSTDKIYYLLLLKEFHTLGGLSDEQYVDLIKTLWGIDIQQHKKEAKAEDKLYIRIYADDEPSVKAEKLYQICGETQSREVAEWLKEYFPFVEPKTGEWIKTVDGNGWNEWEVLACPFCGAAIEDKYYHSWKYNFCPNCGARMTPYKGGDTE